MFIAQTLIYPPRCVPLLLDPGFVLLEYLVDDRNERVKLWERTGGCSRRYPGGTECFRIFDTVLRSMPK